MLRMHCVQLCYNVSDIAMEDMLHEVESVRRLSGIRLEKVADERRSLNVRHLLERHGLVQVLFETIKEHLAEQGLMLKEGTVMDGSIIAEPPATKNRKRERDWEMKQSKKWNQWRLGMKLHIGVDDPGVLVHSLAPSAAKVHDLISSERVLPGEEVGVLGDGGYQGIEKSEARQDRKVAWPIAMCPGQYRKLAGEQLERLM